MVAGSLLKYALDQAAVWHRDQRRKYPNSDVPYMSHLAGVAGILGRHGFSEEVCAAGALHDCMEDCGVTFEQLKQMFNEPVAVLVHHVSEEDKSLSWEERKARYLDHFRVKPWEAQAITLADKIDNFLSIIVCKERHGDPWAMFKRGRDAQLERFVALEQAITKPHALADEYRQTLRALETI
ncbi:MAG: HD domain-containing protein [Kofleriaceae bacterium]